METDTHPQSEELRSPLAALVLAMELAGALTRTPPFPRSGDVR